MIVAEVTGDVQTDYYYDESGNVFGFKRGNSEYYYIRNGQGDIIGILDSSGTQIVSYVYDSWGKLVSISGSQAETIGEVNPFRYRGYYYDTETGLYYLQSRYYDPEVGRFINGDDRIIVNNSLNEVNLFSYCGNNPVINSDPTGHSIVAIVGLIALVGGIIAGCTGSTQQSDVTIADKTPIDPSKPSPPSSGYVPPKKILILEKFRILMVAVKVGQVKEAVSGFRIINNMVDLVGQNSFRTEAINITIQMDTFVK